MVQSILLSGIPLRFSIRQWMFFNVPGTEPVHGTSGLTSRAKDIVPLGEEPSWLKQSIKSVSSGVWTRDLTITGRVHISIVPLTRHWGFMELWVIIHLFWLQLLPNSLPKVNQIRLKRNTHSPCHRHICDLDIASTSTNLFSQRWQLCFYLRFAYFCCLTNALAPSLD